MLLREGDVVLERKPPIGELHRAEVATSVLPVGEILRYGVTAQAIPVLGEMNHRLTLPYPVLRLKQACDRHMPIYTLPRADNRCRFPVLLRSCRSLRRGQARPDSDDNAEQTRGDNTKL